jgi:Sec23/Sec24 helical domain
VETTLSSKLEDARQMLQLKLVKSFKEYRNLYAVQHRLSGRLIFPDSLKYLPLYMLALCKSLALRGGYADVSLDERCASGYTMMVLPIASTVRLLYPALYRMDELLTKVILVLFNFGS